MMRKPQKILCALCAALMLLAIGCAGVPIQRESSRIVFEGMSEEVIQTFDSADEAFREKRFDRAIALYKSILERFPSGRAAYLSHLKSGEVFIAREKYDRAIEELKLIPGGFEEDPIHAEARCMLALSYLRLGMNETSEDICKELLSGKVPSYLKPEIESLMGDILLESGRNRAAFDWYMESLKSKPGTKLKKSVKKKIEDIIADGLSLDQLQEMEKDYWWGYPSGYLLYALAVASCDIRNFEKADEYLNRFLSGHKEHPLFEKGETLHRRIVSMKLVNHYAIGCVLPLTGKHATYGNRVLDAVILASGIFNIEHDSPIQLFIEDSKCDPDTTRKAVRRLADEHHVIGIIGPLGSAAALEAAKEAQELEVPIITLTQKKDITETGDYVFRDFLTGDMQVKALVTYSIDNLGIKNFAILYPDDNYGRKMMDLFWDEVLWQGGQIRGVESYSSKHTDFGKEIKALTGLNLSGKDKISGEKPIPIVNFDALFIPDSYSTVNMIAPQLAFYDVIGVQLLGTNIWNFQELLKKEIKYLEGAIFTDCFSLDSACPEVRNFIDRFYVACGREPDNMEALAYDATKIMADLITEDYVETRDDLKDSLLCLEDYPGITGMTSFSGTGDAKKPLHMLTVMDGEIVQIR
ncbi:MAG: penicillin-binding protein activator [Thermodesulfobacteriota bacterium]|nr:penicillin-binding protein activator [Thermodesulfobacteriota bacterium]